VILSRQNQLDVKAGYDEKDLHGLPPIMHLPREDIACMAGDHTQGEVQSQKSHALSVF
jgi:hypothetical protein